MTLGLEHNVNRLCAYSDDWPVQFSIESEKILSACRDHVIAIEHVGSTSIQGLVAKPIVDIMIGVRSLDVADKMVNNMRSIGYDYPGDIGIPAERIFGRDPGFRRFLVHVVVFKSANWFQYLKFRDVLRADEEIAQDYGNLKLKIAKQHPQGRALYTKLKSAFIQEILKQSE